MNSRNQALQQRKRTFTDRKGSDISTLKAFAKQINSKPIPGPESITHRHKPSTALKGSFVDNPENSVNISELPTQMRRSAQNFQLKNKLEMKSASKPSDQAS